MTKQDHWHSSLTQIFWAAKALIEGRRISHKTEIRKAKRWRLVAICWKLQHEYDWSNRIVYRGPEAIAYYRLTPGTDPAKLKYPPSARHPLEGGAA
jgi:hypothetical protein